MKRRTEAVKLAYTVEEAAELLSISRAHLYRLVFGGVIETIQIGRSRRITRRQLDEFLSREESQGGS